jgi:hypothetical protein
MTTNTAETSQAETERILRQRVEIQKRRIAALKAELLRASDDLLTNDPWLRQDASDRLVALVEEL